MPIQRRLRQMLRPLVKTPGARFDSRFGVKSELVLQLDELTLEGDARTGHSHVPTPPRLAHAWLDAIGTPLPDLTLVDMGSGAGRVLLLASKRPFARIIGVEFASELHDLAVDNIRRFPTSRMKCRDVTSLHGDATRFAFPPDPLVVFFNNPFGEEIMSQVIANLESSYRATPRPVTAVYQQLADEEPGHRTNNLALLDRCGYLTGRTLEYSERDQPWLEPYLVKIYESVEVLSNPPPPQRRNSGV